MDLSKDVVLKENYTFLVADAGGQITGGEHGLYSRDTRFLSSYAWFFGEGFETLLAHTPRPDRFEAHYALIEGPSQLVGVGRRFELSARGLIDTLTLENTGLEARDLRLELSLASDFVDMFEARGWTGVEREPAEFEGDDTRVVLRYEAEDGLSIATKLSFSRPASEVREDGVSFEVRLEPGERVGLEVKVELENPLETEMPAISYESWRDGFDLEARGETHQRVLRQAIDDLRALLLFNERGAVPAAGIPWFVAPFGRDSLLTAIMMLPWHPEITEGTLRFLAAYQGGEGTTQSEAPGKMLYDTRAEAPGKIMHELRQGELSRTGRVPFGPYYGTVDATALFVMLLRDYWGQTGRLELVKELRPHWEAALAWMQEYGDLDGDGFLEFRGAEPGEGLSVQSWKDSHDSMSHQDGSLATGALAVSEVQGYAYAAYLAAADFYTELSEEDKAARWREEADALKEKFHEAFWLPDMQTYAMALDGDKKPLKVHNSDAGQLLWTGIVPEEVAPKLVQTLFSEANWTGWGIRTLGKGEARYNPVSYHNGSVWPHDTALIAGGLARYGFLEEAARIREALYDLAASQADKRLPELVGGYERTGAPPVPYPVACRPQAWDAAALLYLLRF